ncbi:hypothetical protein B0H14DRAFT_3488356 [Mycena olivaceomarginata]|nr:hypothetical protein B0H14DRAFT_3488356 [Mycena olivaceomarginata]
MPSTRTRGVIYLGAPPTTAPATPVLSHLRVLLGVIITMSAAFCTIYAQVQNQVPADVAPRSQSNRDGAEKERRERGDAAPRPRNAARSRAQQARRRNEESDRQRAMDVDAPMDLRAAAAPTNRPSLVLQALNNGGTLTRRMIALDVDACHVASRYS